ncbi:PriCT-2 domain-containing protein [Rhodoferax antarcticus]|uniref:PriCT-2 domain-containing protein n=1 Tax=Rhodoferax antarcticus TaxID=81479 RepID=UPI00222466E3|nr:PriCT-2 domain-containing protein [Rhodoferax antarcticus]MCW2314323.1 putative DNA primase/helicase [Rhodoferax antarcticus]
MNVNFKKLPTAQTDGPGHLASHELERACSALFFLNADDREIWLRAAMAMKSEFDDAGFDIWDEWAAQSAAYNAADARSVWRSIKADGKITIGTLFYDAREAGWQDSSTYKKPSAAEIEQRRQERAKRDAEAQAQEEAQHEAAAARAQALWEAAQPCEAHPYLARKGVKSHGLRFGPWARTDSETGEVFVTPDCLLIALCDRQKNVHSLQLIKPDGTKLFMSGGAKAGHFYAIGSQPLLVDGQPVFVLAEGYATGASVHEATGHLVRVCMDAGNLLNVAKVLRQEAPEATIVIAADNDTQTDGNPGMTAACKAARAVGALMAFPPDGGDFNDLHLTCGLQAVAEVIGHATAAPTQELVHEQRLNKQLAPALAPGPSPLLQARCDGAGDDEPSEVDSEGYFSVLGFNGDHYYVLHKAKRQVIVRTRKDFNEIGLVELAPINWWEMYFSNGKGVDKTMAADWIFRLAHRRGAFTPEDRIRGRGAWLDDGRVVFHHGDRLTVDGAEMDLHQIHSCFVYEAAAALPPMGVPASDDEGRYLVDVAKMARWANPASAQLLAGWIFLAPICGALHWRAHIWITGPAGCGKSSILDRFIGKLLGGLKLQVDAGDSSAAGVRQVLEGDARPVILDEAESNTDQGQNRIRGMLTLARGASSAGDSKVVKGTVGGKAMEFRIRSMFCFGSIGSSLKDKESDASRFALLSLRGPGRGDAHRDNWPEMKQALGEIAVDSAWAARLQARALGMMPILTVCINIFSAAVAEKLDANQRCGDQYGTLLAGAWCLCRSTAVTQAQAKEIVEAVNFDDYMDRDAAPDASRCLEQILDASLVEKGSSITIRTLVLLAASQKIMGVEVDRDRAKQMLQERGMTITRLGNKGLYLGVIRNSPAITALLRGTAFAADWQSHLPRVEGYEPLPSTSFGSGRKDRGHGFALNKIGLLDDDKPPI